MACHKPLWSAAFLWLAVLLSACNSNSAKLFSVSEQSPQERDVSVREAIESSETWRQPRCRWLETGAWVLAYSDEEKLYRAVSDVGFIELEVVGQGNRYGVAEPAYRVKLREQGITETAECKSSKPTVWGVSVSRREFISATYTGEAPNAGLTIYHVVFKWQPAGG